MLEPQPAGGNPGKDQVAGGYKAMETSYWWFVLLGLFLVVFLFVFFWTTPYDEEEARKR